LKESLTSELPGILNLSLRAYADAVEKSFTIPQSCIDAGNNWRMEADQVLQFIEDECVRNPKEEAPVKSLYEAYLQWASVSGVNRTVGMKSFRDRLTNLGFGSRRTAKARYVTGLAVNMKTESDFCNV
jgi:putative DNA primase/helicase